MFRLHSYSRQNFIIISYRNICYDASQP